MAGHIVVIDDEQPVRLVLERVLHREGYGVRLASNGQEGLTLIRDQKPDLVILDWFLPDMPGAALVRHIREILGSASIPMLVLSGRPDDALPLLVEQMGIALMAKPFDVPTLCARLKTMLASSSRTSS